MTKLCSIIYYSNRAVSNDRCDKNAFHIVTEWCICPIVTRFVEMFEMEKKPLLVK